MVISALTSGWGLIRRTLANINSFKQTPYSLLFTSKQLKVRFPPENLIVIFAGINELKSSFCAIYYLLLFSILKQHYIVYYFTPALVASGGYFTEP